MDQDNNSTSDMQDDVMLSSAEDLNTEMNFGLETAAPIEDVEIEREVTEVEQTEEAPETAEPERHHERPRERAELVTMQVCKPRVNKFGLVWMIILTIILAGVVGMMIYAFLLRPDTGTIADGDNAYVYIEDENNVVVAGALEVYLSEVNLSNYDSDIVLVNRGGTVTLTGSFAHTVYVSASAEEKLVLDNVAIHSASNAALVNLGAKAIEINLVGDNSLIAAGENKYNAALYSDGALLFDGSGSLMIGAETSGMAGIATKNGYSINGGNIVILGQKSAEEPLDSSTQAYFKKDGLQNRAKGTLVVAIDDNGEKTAEFISNTAFSAMLVSNDSILDGERYEITLKDASTTE